MDEQKTTKPTLNIGQLIKDELERQERSVSWFARKLYCDRSNVYKIFKRSTIDTELLIRISGILNHDFFSDYVSIVTDNMKQQAEWLAHMAAGVFDGAFCWFLCWCIRRIPKQKDSAENTCTATSNNFKTHFQNTFDKLAT